MDPREEKFWNDGDGLAVGLTRPAMLFGVPQIPLIFVGVLWVDAALMIKAWALPIGPIGYVVIYALAKWEPHFFSVLKAWATTASWQPAIWRIWNATTLDPLPVRAPDGAR